MFALMAMYVMYLSMGHMLLCKTIKSSTIRIYVTKVAKAIQQWCKAYIRTHPTSGLTWYSPIQAHGSMKMALEITACLKEVERWENMKDHREPLTVDMIHYQKTLCRQSTPHSLAQAMYDWETMGIYASFHLTEWAQTEHFHCLDQVKVTIDGDPAAFLIDNINFKGEKRWHMTQFDALC